MESNNEVATDNRRHSGDSSDNNIFHPSGDTVNTTNLFDNITNNTNYVSFIGKTGQELLTQVEEVKRNNIAESTRLQYLTANRSLVFFCLIISIKSSFLIFVISMKELHRIFHHVSLPYLSRKVWIWIAFAHLILML